MYLVKRLISDIVNYPANGNSDPDVMADALEAIHTKATEALQEAEQLERSERDEPQEMRDLFAAAALLKVNSATVADLAPRCWDISDAMMIERRKRMDARKGVTYAED